MAIHPGGARLFSSIPFKHLAQVGDGGGGAVNVALNVTPFVDMMTILVSFLLMVFSSSGELIASEQGLVIPNATNNDAIKVAPVLTVSPSAVKFNDKVMASTLDLIEESAADPKIPTLFVELKDSYEDFMKSDGGYARLSDTERGFCTRKQPAVVIPEEMCQKGLLILQADRNTPAKVLTRIIKTANQAGYNNILFAITVDGAE